MYNNSGLLEAVIEQVKVNEVGQVVIDVFDEKGDFYEGVKICGVGGNTFCWSNFPVRAGQHVKLVKLNYNDHPICIGSTEKFFNEEDYENLRPIVATVVDNTEDVVSNYITDWSIVNNQTGLKVTEKNGLIAETLQTIRFQLGPDSIFRISKNGTTVDEPLNGQQFIDTLFAYLDALEAKVNANSQFVSAAAPGVTAAYTAAAVAADASAPGSGQVFRDQSQTATEAATEAAVPLATTSATTKTSAEDNINRNIKLP